VTVTNDVAYEVFAVVWFPGLGEYIRPRGYDAPTMQLVCDVIADDIDRGLRHTVHLIEEEFMALNTEEERFRSFAERYVIERAQSFTVGHEQEEAWRALLDAKSLYMQVKGMGSVTFGQQDTTQAPMTNGQTNPASGGLVPRAQPKVSQQMAHDALKAAETAPRKGALRKLKDAARRIGGGSLP
jgi:hypothetical protein